MPTTKIPFAGQAYADRTLNANAQAAINLYPMLSPESGLPGDRGRIVMYPTPGYSLLYDLIASSGVTGVGAIRGGIVINTDLYVVSGTRFLKITNPTAPVATALGTLTTSSGRCSITCNTVEITISDGTNGYVYNLVTPGFTTISGGSWAPVTNLTFIDGYTLGAIRTSSRVIQSNLLASGTWGAQAYVDVASYPDNNTAVFSDQNQLYIFGPRLTEVRGNASSVPFAFQKVQGALIQAGCVAWPTIVKVGNSLIWLAQDVAGRAYVASLEGYSTKVLSTPPINEAMERYATITDAFAYSYREGDTQFYCLTFPTADVTWALDVGTGMWHQRSVSGGRDLPDHYFAWNDLRVVGDSSGKLWLMGQEFNTGPDGQGLTRVRSCQKVAQGGQVVFIDELEVEVEAGTSTQPFTEALATLEVSKDGGHTWVNCGAKSLGAQGDYKRRLVWRKLGYSRNGWCFRLTVTDAVRVFILGATAKVRGGK